MSRIVCFGELMLRLNPEGYLRFVQSDKYEATFGGGEANVSVSLSNYGHDAAFVSKLPEHEIGTCAVNSLRRYGVDTKHIVRGGDRVGIYYCEKGASQRPSKVVYDRKYSAISMAQRSDFDWDKILENVDFFHFTGITPALGGEMPAICLDALKKCKEKNITVSCDLNYRNKLWTKAEANRVMSELVPYVDVLISNEEDAADVFNIHAENTDVSSGKINKDGYISVAKQLQERFSLQKVAITLRGSISANDNNWAGMLYQDGKAYFSKDYLVHIVDRVGGGDSFGGGLIHSVLSSFDPQKTIEFAVAASCLKHTIEHDYNLVSEKEVLALANGSGSGRVQR